MANTDKFIKGARRFSTTVAAGGIADAVATTSPLTSIPSVFSDGDTIEFIVDRVSTTGDKTPALEETIVGTVSGTNVVDCDRGVEGTAQEHAAGAVVEIKLTSDMWNRMVEGILKEHGLDGIHDINKMITEGTVLDEDDMASDSATALITQQSVKAMHDTGWTAITETLTYDSPTTITVASGAPSRYQKGDKLKLTQATDKYFYIVGVADTVLTVTGGSDYTLTNDPITSPQLSRIENPFGFPEEFNWIPSLTNITLGNGSLSAKFSLSAKRVDFQVVLFWGNTTSASGNQIFSVPVPMSGDNLGYIVCGNGIVADGTVNYIAAVFKDAANSQLRLVTNDGNVTGTVPFTWGSNDVARFSGSYWI